jgi:hypothetical protein
MRTFPCHLCKLNSNTVACQIEAAQLGVQAYRWWVQTRWRAPEVFEDEENRDKDTKSSGVYSFAIIFFEVLDGKVPTNVLQSICDRVRLGFARCGLLSW